jgi:hypothetical protein
MGEKNKLIHNFNPGVNPEVNPGANPGANRSAWEDHFCLYFFNEVLFQSSSRYFWAIDILH